MSFPIALRAEVLKTKRTASFWLTVMGAAFIPALFFLAYTVKPEGSIKQLAPAPWTVHFLYGWQALSSFLFPMYIILICSPIPIGIMKFLNRSESQYWIALIPKIER